jgi:hypothetical protein
VSTISAVGRAGSSLLVDHARRAIETGGELVVLGVESVVAAVTDIVGRRF